MSVIVTAIDAMRRRPRVLLGGFVFLLGAIVLFDFIAARHGEHFVGDRIRGFWALFGLAGCVGMTKFMKGIGHGFLMQPTDFYSKNETGEDN
jgi:hypothetical protein